MVWFMVLQIVSTLIALNQLRRTSVSDKELEILLLRRQLAIYERKHPASFHRTHLRRRHTAVRALPFEAVGGPFSVDSNGPILRDVRGS